VAETRECERRSYSNPSDQRYCLKCGKYLLGKQEEGANGSNIWAVRQSVVSPNGKRPLTPGGNNGSTMDCLVVECPQCRQIEKTPNGVLPPACGSCGYMFQYGVDKAVYYSTLVNGSSNGKQQPKQPSGDGASNTPGDRTSVSKTVQKEDSSLRIHVRSESSILPQKVDPVGDIIGKDATILTKLQMDAQLKIFRAPVGWYLEVLQGECNVDGTYLNKHMQRKLKNGNVIFVGKHKLFVEITE